MQADAILPTNLWISAAVVFCVVRCTHLTLTVVVKAGVLLAVAKITKKDSNFSSPFDFTIVEK